MNNQQAGFALNRIQRKQFVRRLIATVTNTLSRGDTAGYTDEQRIKAARLLIEFGNKDEIVQTFQEQLLSQNPTDLIVNQAIMDMMAEGYRQGMRLKEEDDSEASEEQA